MTVGTRRPLKTRERRWAHSLARWLAARGVRPNAVSAASVLFAALAGLCLHLSFEKSSEISALLLVGAAALVQLRLLCNMLDGLIAVEGGLGSPAGEVWNDLPDRFADALILVGAGLAVRRMPAGVTLGWIAALLAVLTAYVRVLGGALGLPQSFAGPMAKQTRMFFVTLGCLAAAAEAALGRRPIGLYATLLVVASGSAVTVVARTARIVRQLSAR
jgi:phosphatidylglycerophosphate synthase